MKYATHECPYASYTAVVTADTDVMISRTFVLADEAGAHGCGSEWAVRVPLPLLEKLFAKENP